MNCLQFNFSVYYHFLLNRDFLNFKNKLILLSCGHWTDQHAECFQAQTELMSL